MKKTGRVPLSKSMQVEYLMTANGQGQPVMWSEQGSEKDLLLRHPNFVAKPTNASFEPPPLACEASALSAELTAPNRIYLAPKPRQKRAEARGLFANLWSVRSNNLSPHCTSIISDQSPLGQHTCKKCLVLSFLREGLR